MLVLLLLPEKLLLLDERTIYIALTLKPTSLNPKP